VSGRGETVAAKTTGNAEDTDEPDHSGKSFYEFCGFHEWLDYRRSLF